ncbi:hypothetical protein MMP61_19025 [Acinetobacter sp. NIPH 1958]|uniref:hypothetical protein n=1 Tax=Acinetobacter sp. NIPH 1958 TaxID=2923430 RepID=UPI001F4B3AD0|nr:hypothetical protein [Acinetobacter sp. NIPH 1958]MCH7357633.1 hypothetical protein [Acinetobacter sp. NIPH 1958]
MNNYKIKVNDEAESKEAQELFKQLGYKIECFVPVGFPRWVATTDKEEDFWYSTGFPLIASLAGFQELTLPQLRDLVAKSKNEQGLISGADALRALADGENVQWISKDFHKWDDLDTWNANTRNFLDEKCIIEGGFKYRLKPRTITLSLEIPAPFEPKRGETAFLLTNDRFGYMEIEYQGHSTTLGAWRTEEEIKQVVAALRGIKG